MSSMDAKLEAAADAASEAAEYIDDMENALRQIVQWSEAYPLDIFPEPDLKKARELLAAGGITLDAVSAHCMRHVIQRVAEIAKEVLPGKLLPHSPAETSDQ